MPQLTLPSNPYSFSQPPSLSLPHPPSPAPHLVDAPSLEICLGVEYRTLIPPSHPLPAPCLNDAPSVELTWGVEYPTTSKGCIGPDAPSTPSQVPACGSLDYSSLSSRPLASLPSNYFKPLQSRQAKVNEDLVNLIIIQIGKFLSVPSNETVDRIRECVGSVSDFMSSQYNEEVANVWANGFVFPPSYHTFHKLRLEKAGSLGNLIAAIQRDRAEDRISLKRVKKMVPWSDPDYDKLVEISQGVRLTIDPSFKPNLKPNPLRSKYKALQHAVNKLIAKGYDSQRIIIPLESALAIEGIHFSEVHWIAQWAKIMGRLCGDFSDSSVTNCINTEWVKEKCRERWGPLNHPTLTQFVAIICSLAEQHGWDSLILFKMDLSNAFGLIDIHPTSVQLLAFPLTDNLVMLDFTGNFGLTETPFVFGPISRACETAVNRRIFGGGNMYVDDTYVCTTSDHLVSDMAMTEAFLKGLLGPNAINKAKEVTGRRVDILGWCIDLDLRTVTIASHNFKKLLFGLFSLDETSPVSYLTVERLCSWFQRYGEICVHLKPFLPVMYDSLANWRNKHAARLLSEDAIVCVNMWRMYTVLLKADETSYARPLTSFLPQAIQYVIEYDASLSGLGIVISGGTDPITATIFMVAQISILPFELGDDAGYQNTVEFLAITIAVAILASQGITNCGIPLWGDNVASLAWSDQMRFRNRRSNRAARAFVALLITGHYTIEDTHHVKGEENIMCDRLSRWEEYHETPTDLGFSFGVIFDIDQSPLLSRLLAFCNPKLPLSGMKDNELASRQLSSIIHSLLPSDR